MRTFSRMTVCILVAFALGASNAACGHMILSLTPLFLGQYSPRPETKPADVTSGVGPRMAPAGKDDGSGSPKATESDIADMVQKAEASVVKVETEGRQGSGFVARADGWIVTNYHVMAGARKASVSFGDKTAFNVEGYLAVRPGNDLVLLKIRPPRELPVLRLAEAAPRKMQKVVAIGNPQGFSFSATSGDVSAIRNGREIAEILRVSNPRADLYQAMGYDPDAEWIQTSTPISPGSSGGPLLDSDSRVVGVCTWIKNGSQNLNFAISAKHVRDLVREAEGARLQSLATLPKRKPELQTASDGSWKIELPSGKVVSEKTFHLNAAMIDEWFASRAQIEKKAVATKTTQTIIDGLLVITQVEYRYFTKRKYYPNLVIQLKHVSGEVYAIASHERGILDGFVLGFHDNEKLMACLQYSDGKRDGAMRTYDDAGCEVYWCQYDQGKRNGLSCFFEEGQLRLVCEWTKDELVAAHAIQNFRLVKSHASREAIADDSEVAPIFDRLVAQEKEMTKNEKDLKALVKKQYEEYVMEFVRANRLKSRSDATDAINRHRAENNAAMKRFADRYGAKPPPPPFTPPGPFAPSPRFHPTDP